MSHFLNLSTVEKLGFINAAFHRLKTQFLYRGSFAAIGRKTTIFRPLLLSGTRYMRIGERVLIREGVRLEAIQSHPHRKPNLTIGDNTNIEQYVHIICHNRVSIGSNVSITGFCSIVDVTHPHGSLDQNAKIGDLIADDDASVEIADGAFIGMGSIILPNVRIGKRAVVGANSVVTKNVADGCVVAGVPARLLSAPPTTV
jgi:acetyltransferase-like isoleucine patch superfamily enzyme